MAVIQVALDIPETVLAGISNGKYILYGGTVRHAVGSKNGKIVTLLKPGDVKTVNEVKNVEKIAKNIPKSKCWLIAGIVVAVSLTGIVLYEKYKAREPGVIKRFRKELNTYLSVVKDGNMNLKNIDALLVAIEKLKTYIHYNKVYVQLTVGELEILVNKIYEYTMKLAEKNNVVLCDKEKQRKSNIILELHKDLITQKRIFKEVA